MSKTPADLGIEAAKEEDMQRKMFGCTTAECQHGLERHTKFYHNANMALGSILSDVQELIARPTEQNLETARQYLNRVKKALFEAQPITLGKGQN